MDVNKYKKAVAMLDSLYDLLPAGDTTETYVRIYHKLLDDLQAEIEQDLSTFRVPAAELKREPSGGHYDDFGEWVDIYPDERSCDRTVFRIHVEGAVRFIKSLETPLRIDPACGAER